MRLQQTTFEIQGLWVRNPSLANILSDIWQKSLWQSMWKSSLLCGVEKGVKPNPNQSTIVTMFSKWFKKIIHIYRDSFIKWFSKTSAAVLLHVGRVAKMKFISNYENQKSSLKYPFWASMSENMFLNLTTKQTIILYI